MSPTIALLRAVNVGGTGKLAMADLRALCAAIGFARVRTFIASGNVVFDTDLSEAGAKAALERALSAQMGKPVDVIIRSGAQMAAVLAANPFPNAEGGRVAVTLLDGPPAADALAGVSGRTNERIALGAREIYVDYGAAGIGRSRLKIPAARAGTARNINTLTTLAAWANKG